MGRIVVLTEQASETLTKNTELRKEVRVMFAYILNCHGQPLMPCKPRKARLLLKTGKPKWSRWFRLLCNCSMAAVATNKSCSWALMPEPGILASLRRRNTRCCLRLKCSHVWIFRRGFPLVSSFVVSGETEKQGTGQHVF